MAPGFQSGFSMIEALVAIVVLAVGLLGLAFLQAQSLKFNTSAYARTQASILAGDIIDRMRLNAANAANYATASASGTCDPLATGVDNDITCWLSQVQRDLPSGSATITDNGGGSFTITVNWTEQFGARLDDGASAPSNPALSQRTVSWNVEL